MSGRFAYRTDYSRLNRVKGTTARTYRYKRRATKFGRGGYRKKFKGSKLNNGNVMSYRAPRNMPMPNIFNTKVTWSGLHEELPAVAGVFKTFNVFINNLNDPGGTISATEPAFHSRLMNFYGRYVVHACKISINAISLSDSTGTGDVIFGCFPSVSTAQAGNITNLPSAIAAQGSRYTGITRYGNGGTRTVKNYCKVKSLMGLKDIVDDPTYSGFPTLSPSSLPAFRCFVGSRDLTSNAGGSFVIKATYYVSYYRRDNEDLVIPA